jgi:hypothetical protein
MSTERARDLEAQVDEALRAFARRCPPATSTSTSTKCARASSPWHVTTPQRGPEPEFVS